MSFVSVLSDNSTLNTGYRIKITDGSVEFFKSTLLFTVIIHTSANGGLGRAFDELELNRVLCEQNDVRIAGVIINKVIPDKYEQTKYYMQKAIMQTWGIPLLGCIPDRP